MLEWNCITLYNAGDHYSIQKETGPIFISFIIIRRSILIKVLELKLPWLLIISEIFRQKYEDLNSFIQPIQIKILEINGRDSD